MYIDGVKWMLVKVSQYHSKEFRRFARRHNRQQIKKLILACIGGQV